MSIDKKKYVPTNVEIDETSETTLRILFRRFFFLHSWCPVTYFCGARCNLLSTFFAKSFISTCRYKSLYQDAISFGLLPFELLFI